MSHNQKTGEILDGLPVFSTDTVVWDDKDFPKLQYSKEDSAVRVTLTDACQPFGTVQELVDNADELFERFAKMCSATLIEHEWGFARLPETPSRSTSTYLARHTLYPSGFTLVARVEIIRRVFNKMPVPTYQGVISGHNQALALGLVGGMEPPTIETEEPVRLSDYPLNRQYKLPSDFAYGRRGDGFANPNALYFVDIEPYVLSNDAGFKPPYEPNRPGNEDIYYPGF